MIREAWWRPKPMIGPHVFDPSYADARRCVVCSQQRASPIHVEAKERP